MLKCYVAQRLARFKYAQNWKDVMTASVAQELGILVERVMNFMNLWTIYNDLLSGKYKPLGHDARPEHFRPQTTMLLILYSYFYSLVEDSPDGINAFRVWRTVFPDEQDSVTAVEKQVQPFLTSLRVFRNRLGFHGSRTRQHEAPGFDLFGKHSGIELWNALKNFKALSAALLGKQMPDKYDPQQTRQYIDQIKQRALFQTV